MSWDDDANADSIGEGTDEDEETGDNFCEISGETGSSPCDDESDDESDEDEETGDNCEIGGETGSSPRDDESDDDESDEDEETSDNLEIASSLADAINDATTATPRVAGVGGFLLGDFSELDSTSRTSEAAATRRPMMRKTTPRTVKMKTERSPTVRVSHGEL